VWAGFFTHRLQHLKYGLIYAVGRKALLTLLGLIKLGALQGFRIPTVSVTNDGLKRIFLTGICVFE
jgi:hypothetical protein